MCEDLLPYFRDSLLMTAAKLQSWTDDVARSEDGGLDNESSTCDNFGKSLLECIAGMPTEQVGVAISVDNHINIFLLCRLAHY